MSNGQEEKKIMKPENVIQVTPVKVREGFARKKEDSVILERKREITPATERQRSIPEKKVKIRLG